MSKSFDTTQPYHSPHTEIRGEILDLVRNKRTRFPTLPVVAHNIITLINDEHSSASDLAEFINKDQAIANKVLRLANSSYYGMSRKIETILRAITVVGFNEIVNLAIAISVFPSAAFHRKAGFDMEGLWLHAIGCSFAAKLIRETVLRNKGKDRRLKENDASSKNIFLPALFHDIGKIIFAMHFPVPYRNVLEESNRVEEPLHETEARLLGLDHSVLSGILMDYWNFPDSILLPVRHHHAPATCPDNWKIAAEIVHLADYITRAAGIGSSGNSHLESAELLLDELPFSVEQLTDFTTKMQGMVVEVEGFLTQLQ